PGCVRVPRRLNTRPAHPVPARHAFRTAGEARLARTSSVRASSSLRGSQDHGEIGRRAGARRRKPPEHFSLTEGPLWLSRTQWLMPTPTIGHRKGMSVTPDRSLPLSPTMRQDRPYTNIVHSRGQATPRCSTIRSCLRTVFVSLAPVAQVLHEPLASRFDWSMSGGGHQEA